jgi:ABC-2 type transport system ATP-binding protein
VAGHDVVTEAAQVRRHIGLTGQYAALDESLTGRANLIMVGQLCRLSKREAGRRTWMRPTCWPTGSRSSTAGA